MQCFWNSQKSMPVLAQFDGEAGRFGRVKDAYTLLNFTDNYMFGLFKLVIQSIVPYKLVARFEQLPEGLHV